ncbi:DUF5984 family protein [Streptomyces niveus]
MIRFRFGLTPVHDIQPWGGDTPSPSWFSLTDGWYDIEADGRHLFRHPAGGTSVDYYVVRLWEDVLDALPQALEPVPADLVAFMAGDHTDLPHLRHEQRDRASWLGRALERACDTDWAAVRAGVSLLVPPPPP